MFSFGVDDYFEGDYEKIKDNLYKSNNNIPLNNEDLCQYYDNLLKLRHNLLHFCVLNSMGLKWENEQTVRDKLCLPDNNDLLSKTPDIIFIDGMKIILIDVSISLDISINGLRKIEKYQPICNYLERTYNYEATFIHINVKSSLSNLEKETYKIRDIQKKDFPLQFFNQCVIIIEDKNQWINLLVDREYFNNFKERYKSKDLVDNLGYYSDLEVNLNCFKEFNSKFNIEKEIVGNLENFTENEICDFLKTVIEEKGDIYYHYKDNHCDESQFIEAFHKINENNNIREKIQPKPTHHMIVPIMEDFDFLPRISGKQSEQKMLAQIMKYIQQNDNLNPYFTFVKEFSESYLQLFDEKKPKQKI